VYGVHGDRFGLWWSEREDGRQREVTGELLAQEMRAVSGAEPGKAGHEE